MEKKSPPQICIGYRCGNLVVTAPTLDRKNGYTIWKCTCDCGNECLLDTRTLQRGKVQDCGCISKVPPSAIDLTGQRFGRLTALAPTDKRKYGGIVWHCNCECGQEAYISSKQLMNGYTKSCGCLLEKKNLVGQRFGQLTVLSYEEKSRGMNRWRCKCDCGNETVVGQTQLLNGETKSCGCLQAKMIVENLKLVDDTSVAILEYIKNKPLSKNESGYTGVYLNKKTGKWIAKITFQKKSYYLGSYDKIEDAIKARRKGEEMYDDFLEWYYNTNRL